MDACSSSLGREKPPMIRLSFTVICWKIRRPSGHRLSPL